MLSTPFSLDSPIKALQARTLGNQASAAPNRGFFLGQRANPARNAARKLRRSFGSNRQYRRATKLAYRMRDYAG